MAKRTNGLGIASLILGLLGLFGVLPFMGSLLAIVLGHMAKKQAAEDPELTDDGLATAGIISGWIGLALWAVGVIVVVLIWLFLFGGLALVFAFSGG